MISYGLESRRHQPVTRGHLALLHGYGEHHGLYDALAQRLVADGSAGHALDAVGHGRSDGDRAVIASWDHYVDDAVVLIAYARAEHGDLPLTVLWRSGGAVAAYLVAWRAPGS